MFMLKVALFAFFAFVASPVLAQDAAPVGEGVELVAGVEEGFYRLSPGDTVQIKFMYNPELNEEVQIRPDGRISMPLAGEIDVAGANVTEVIARLNKVYASVLKSPSVIVQVRNFANRRVFVGGEVGRPGMLALVGKQTALGAVMEAGGFKTSSKRSEVIVIRRGDQDEPRLIKLSMKPEGDHGPEAAAFQLQSLDVVLVAESGVARAGRAVDQYIRQLVPITLTGGFTYLWQGALLGGR